MSDLLSVVRSLPEALDSFRNDAAKQWLYENPKVETLLAAASVLAGVVEVCPNCEGTETVMEDSMAQVGIPGGFLPARCPSCRGGVVIKPEALDRAVSAWWNYADETPGEVVSRGAWEAALWAVFGGEE